MNYFVGQRVRWRDPGINDYSPEERDAVLNWLFEIKSVDNRAGEAFIFEVDGPSEAEVYTSELEPYNLQNLYDTYYYIPWPDSQKYMNIDQKQKHISMCVADEDSGTYCGIFAEKDWVDKIERDGL